jgi:hypothetical protein
LTLYFHLITIQVKKKNKIEYKGKLHFHILKKKKKTLGTALPKAVRQKLGTIGQQPGIVESLETQTQRALKMVRSKQSPIEKYMFMAQLRNRNTKVFYQLLKDHIKVTQKTLKCFKFFFFFINSPF